MSLFTGYICELIKKSRVYSNYTMPFAVASGYKSRYKHWQLIVNLQCAVSIAKGQDTLCYSGAFQS